MKNTAPDKKDGFNSRLGVILAAAGSAIGIGNIWRFSYVVGANGGGAFLLIYLICALLVGFPILISELVIGRRSGEGDIGAFKKIAPRSFWWIAGAVGALVAFLIMTYYPVISGWSLGYVFESLFNWESLTADTQVSFDAYVASPLKPLIFQTVVLVLTGLTLIGGVAKGIEKWNKILMPTLMGILVVLIIRSLTLEGSGEGLKFLFAPDFSKITAHTFLEALGHSFYSLSVGMGIMIVYGSFINKKEDLMKTSVSVIAFDTIAALMSGIAIFPAVFALNVDPDSGPGLAFVTLTKAFATLPGGKYFAALFFLLLTIAAVTSMMSLLQVVLAFLERQFGLKRKTAVLIGCAAVFLFSIPAALSFSHLKDFTIFGLTYFDFMDAITANILVPVTGLLVSLFIIFKFRPKNAQKELAEGSAKPNAILIKIYPYLITYIAPVAVIIILLNATGVFKALFNL